MDKRIIHSSQLEWSDEEDDNHKYRTKIKTVDNDHEDDESLDSFQINLKTDHEQGSLVGLNTLADHKRSKFSGYVKVGKSVDTTNIGGLTHKDSVPVIQSRKPSMTTVKQAYPKVPSDVQHILGSSILELIWEKFVEFGADETQLILVSDARTIPKIASDFAQAPLAKTTFLQTREPSDYIDFKLFVIELAKVFNHAKRLMTSTESTVLCYVCCSMHACQHRRPKEHAKYDSTTK